MTLSCYGSAGCSKIGKLDLVRKAHMVQLVRIAHIVHIAQMVHIVHIVVTYNIAL